MATCRGRIRPRPVSFGNPALGTYRGCVYTWEGYDDESKSSSLAAAPNLPPIPSEATSVDKIVAMSDVPAKQVPEGILNLARSHRPFIEHLKIMVSEHHSTMEASTTGTRTRKSPPPQSEMASLSLGEATERLQKSHVAHDLDDDDKDMYTVSTENQEDNERPERSYVILFQLSTQEAADTFVRDLHDVPYTSLDETERCTVYHVVGLQSDDGVSLMSPFFAQTASDLGLTRAATASQSSSSSSSLCAEATSNDSPRKHNSALEVHNCAVCLERMNIESESLLTTVCNHSFHLDCLLQWQDSPCPVCRYDHSGLNDALSQCHVCGTTERNYVCLICGVVSCGGSGGSASRCSTSTTSPALHESSVQNNNSNTTYRSPPMSHARQHYEDTLHAYALEVETQHVWDFCGQGYVHRLLQNAKDDKLVEVNDPNSTSQERSLTPGLSDAQEGEVVHRKLEGFANQYFTLLKSQMEQQRIYYESRLEEIRREYGRDRCRKKSESSPSADLILALKQERNQLRQRCTTLQQRYEKVSDEVAFLKNMNESLEANKAPMRQQVMEAQRQRAEAREMIQQCLPPLEEKVTKLMLQLEESMSGADEVERAPDSAAADKKPAAKR